MIGASVGIPLWSVTLQEVSFRRQSTRQLATSWIYDNLPHGSRILKERYTPNIHGESFEVTKVRWIGSYSIQDLTSSQVDYIVLSHAAYQRFLGPQSHFDEHQTIAEQNYREIFERLELLSSFEPGPIRRGPVIKIYKVAAAGP